MGNPRPSRRFALLLTPLLLGLQLVAAANHPRASDLASESKLSENRLLDTRTVEVGNQSSNRMEDMMTSAEASEEKLKQKPEFPLYMRAIATIACAVIFTVGVCGNLLVLLVVIKTKYLRNSTNLFLINLSIADLLVLIVCMPTVLIELHSKPETWLLGEPMCKYMG